MDFLPNLNFLINVTYSTDIKVFEKCNLKLALINTRSCKNKLAEIESLFMELMTDIHVIIFKETWLTEVDIFNLYGYKAYHSKRTSSRGGGVSVFVKDSILSSLIFSLEFDVNNFLLIELVEYDIKIMGVYNPGYNVDILIEKLDEFFSQLKKIVILGDFNINLFDTNSNTVIKYKEMLNYNGIFTINSLETSFATRLSNTVNTCIDHIHSDIIDKKYVFIVKDIDRDISDHRLLLLGINDQSYSNIPKNSEFHFLKIIKYDQINKQALESKINGTNTIQSLTDVVQDVISENTIKIIKSNRTTSLKPYVSPEILKMLRYKQKLFKLTKKYPINENLLLLYRNYRNIVYKKIKNAKKAYNCSRLEKSKNNLKRTWDIFTEIIHNKRKPKNTDIFLRETDSTISDPKEVSEIFNDYFSCVCQEIRQSLHPICHFQSFLRFPVTNNVFNFTPINASEILIIIENLKNNSAFGIDSISPKILKQFKLEFASKLSILVNNSIDTCCFPDCLKMALVTPILKGGDCLDKQNYRPISVLPIFSKIWESIMLKQLTKYLNDRNILNTKQFGFIPQSNTMTASIHLLNFILKNLDSKRKVSGMFVDIRKAFDCVDHSILLEKLKYYGLSQSAIALVKSYLSQRYQIVKIGVTKSSPKEVKYGIPQGSILGPLLFNIYINDIFEQPLEGYIQLYADDAVFLYNGSNYPEIEVKMKKDITIINNWFNSNYLAMHENKTVLMTFSFTECIYNFNLWLNSVKLKQVDQIKYLGLILQSNLNWKPHIDHIKNKIVPIIFALRKTRNYITERSAWMIYNSFILPHFSYLISVWGASGQTFISQLAKLQNKCIKTIRRLPFLYPSINLYNNSILPIKMLYLYELLIFAYKITNKLIKCNEIFTINEELHQYHTRQRLHYHVIPNRTETANRNAFVRALKLYNKIPVQLKILNLGAYKNNIKRHIYTNYNSLILNV